jgi:hypothetical protein
VKGRGLVLRHSQGDQWDLMVLAPVAAYADLAVAPPLADPALVAWQEDEIVRGPDVARLDGFAAAGLYHIEMFVALAGRRGDLVREREMENTYLAALGRPRNAIFVRELGAAWDAFTIGPYRSWKHFAERDDILPDRSAAAARAAGSRETTASVPTCARSSSRITTRWPRPFVELGHHTAQRRSGSLTMADPAGHANACWNSGEFERGPITRYFEIAWESDFTSCRCSSMLSAAPRKLPPGQEELLLRD